MNTLLNYGFSLDFFVLGSCQTIIVAMENEALDANRGQQGIYSKSEYFNGKPSWKSSFSQAIWYNDIDQWTIGPIDDIGSTNSRYIYAKSEAEEPTDNSNEWNYWDGRNWPTSSSKDVSVRCIGKNCSLSQFVYF